MRDEEFEMLLTDVIREYGANYIEIPAGTYDQPHEFSARFERKMQRLIRRERTFYFPLVKTPVRRMVTIIVAVIAALSATVMSVGAFRDAFANFFAQIFDTHTHVRTLDSDGSPEDFRDIYEITELPEGMELVSKSEDYDFMPYIYYLYENNADKILLHQYIKSRYDTYINTEGYEMIPTEINGCEGFCVNWGDIVLITWDNGDYIFQISGAFDKETMISIAESVQKVK